MRVRRLVFVLLGCAGCSLIVDGELISVHCDDEGALGPPACPTHERCVEHVCVGGQKAAPALGSRCTHDGDCDANDFCLDPTRFGGAGPPVCSRPCCSSSGCDPDTSFVCWAPDVGGGDFCVAASILHRRVGGTGEPGVPCTADNQCRSGLCEASSCSDPCCSDSNCAAAVRTCQFGGKHGASSWTCEPPNEKALPYARCSSDDQCASGLCVDVGGKLRCSEPCCSSSACNSLGSDGVICDEVMHDGTWVRACATVVTKVGTLAVGAPCGGDQECRSARCVKDSHEHGVCTDLCCVASDCGDPMLFECLPPPPEDGGQGDASALRCERK